MVIKGIESGIGMSKAFPEMSKINTASPTEGAGKFFSELVSKVNDIQVKPGKKSPAAPFTTSTLQQEASRKLGYGVSKTMLIAQRLYENGHITYMRTDSVSLSNTALGEITSTVKNLYAEKYHQFRKFKNKNESAQEAHEAIRPTYFDKTSVSDPELNRLYELIWKRTMASQMADAVLEKTVAKILISTNKEELTASGEVLKFDGFLKICGSFTGKPDDQVCGQRNLATTRPDLIYSFKIIFDGMSATHSFQNFITSRLNR